MSNVDQARRLEIRHKILSILDQQRPSMVLESIVLRILVESHLPTTQQELRIELDYLQDKGVIVGEGAAWAIAAPGVDLLEGSVEPMPGLGLMATSTREYHHRQQARWRILQTLNSGRPYGLGQGLLWRVLEDVQLLLTMTELQRELSYLEEKKLVSIKNKSTPEWFTELSATGVDVVEYTIDAPPGIDRPGKY